MKVSNLKINFELVNGLILVKGKINEEEAYLLIDTGASKTVINSEHFSSLERLEIEEKAIIFNQGIKDVIAYQTKVDLIEIENLVIKDYLVRILDLSYFSNFFEEHKIIGVLGLDVLRNYAILIDYEEKELIFNPKEGLENQEIIDLLLEPELLSAIKVTINDYSFNVIIDTGANACLISSKIKEEVKLNYEINEPFLLDKLNIGFKEYNDLVTVISNTDIFEYEDVYGLIGFEVLEKQRIIIDFINEKLYLEK
ncbi:MAG TPA: hypothetical protein GXX66_00570 [Acholeplasmataceae bacterium]|jgi:hypothetical protein|nr:hypothetical protein [Acholeplasmataceae bacterium]